METPFTSAGFKPDAAFASAAERFFELLKTFGMPGAGAAGTGRDWSSLAGPLAGRFEAWLKTSQSAGPWFAAANAAFPGLAAGFGAAPARSLGALPARPGGRPATGRAAQRGCGHAARAAAGAARGALEREREQRRAAFRRARGR